MTKAGYPLSTDIVDQKVQAQRNRHSGKLQLSIRSTIGDACKLFLEHGCMQTNHAYPIPRGGLGRRWSAGRVPSSCAGCRHSPRRLQWPAAPAEGTGALSCCCPFCRFLIYACLLPSPLCMHPLMGTLCRILWCCLLQNGANAVAAAWRNWGFLFGCFGSGKRSKLA